MLNTLLQKKHIVSMLPIFIILNLFEMTWIHLLALLIHCTTLCKALFKKATATLKVYFGLCCLGYSLCNKFFSL